MSRRVSHASGAAEWSMSMARVSLGAVNVGGQEPGGHKGGKNLLIR